MFSDEDVLWADKPEHSKLEYPIVRVPSGKATKGIITSELVGSFVHYTKANGTHPCTIKSGHCASCRHGVSRRWKGYVGLYQGDVTRHIILEVTERLSPQFEQYVLVNGVLRGAAVKIWRMRPVENAPLDMEIQPVDPKKFHMGELPQPPDLRATLLHMWRGNSVPTGEDFGDYPPRATAPRNGRAASNGRGVPEASGAGPTPIGAVLPK